MSTPETAIEEALVFELCNDLALKNGQPYDTIDEVRARLNLNEINRLIQKGSRVFLLQWIGPNFPADTQVADYTIISARHSCIHGRRSIHFCQGAPYYTSYVSGRQTITFDHADVIYVEEFIGTYDTLPDSGGSHYMLIHLFPAIVSKLNMPYHI